MERFATGRNTLVGNVALSRTETTVQNEGHVHLSGFVKIKRAPTPPTLQVRNVFLCDAGVGGILGVASERLTTEVLTAAAMQGQEVADCQT